MLIYPELKFDTLFEAKTFVETAEVDFENRLVDLVRELAAKKDIKIITLSGPSCSGKTTAAKKLVSEFLKYHKRVNIISIDDFYYDKHKLNEISRLKGLETPDYDSADTIDISSLHNFCEEIFSNGCREVHCPIFDFTAGRRTGYRPIECTDDDIFIFEGIQALYPQVTSIFSEHTFHSIYICTKSDIDVCGIIFEPNEIRLMRRIVRDYNFRTTSASQTFELWKSVRSNEDINIFPFADKCEYHIDSTFAFEIALLKPYLDNILSEIQEGDEYYSDAQKILSKISPISSIPKELISENSLYREFI